MNFKTVFILTSVVFFNLHSLAKISGTIVINKEQTEAKLMIYEVMGAGELSKLYDQMQVGEVIEKNTRSKSFKLSNNLFLINCQKIKSNMATTNCSLTIRKGQPSEDFQSEIFTSNDKKYAFFKASSRFSHELDGIFLTQSNGDILYALQLPNYITVDVNGNTQGPLTLGFYFN